MPWNLLLQVLLPIILTPNHPHAPEAHEVMADAHTASATPLAPGTAATKAVDVLTRALALQLKAQSVSGAEPTETTQKIAAALATALDSIPKS